MKKSIALSILGLAAVTASSFGRGLIWLDNYNSNGGYGGPIVTYGPIWHGMGVPANGFSGPLGTPGTGLNSNWTAGLYFTIGTPYIADPTSPWEPNQQLSLATGAGSTAQFDSGFAPIPGEFSSPTGFNTGAPVGSVITAELVVYAGSSYASALYRMHSAPFTITTQGPFPPFTLIGDAMLAGGIGSMSVIAVPETRTLTFAGLGGLALWLMRRKKT